MGRNLFKLAAAMIGVACVIGCACGPPVERQLETAFDAFKDLGVAVEAYRAGSGRWPNSPEELRRSPGLTEMVGLDRYKNLRFEPQPDGGLTISFDEWAAPCRRAHDPENGGATEGRSRRARQGAGGTEVKLEYESRESQREREPDTDPAGHRRHAASRCAVASAIIFLGGAVMVGTGAIADSGGMRAGDIPMTVGLFTLAVSGLFFIGCIAFSSRK
jgi:hypothetical protein